MPQIHFRLTRPAVYGTGTPGRNHRSARQGYYVTADSPQAAADELRKREPSFANEYFDVQYWDKSDNHGKIATIAV